MLIVKEELPGTDALRSMDANAVAEKLDKESESTPAC